MTRASSKRSASRRSAGQKPGRSHLERRWLGAQLGTHQPKQQAYPHSKADHHSPCHRHNPELIWGLFWHGYLSYWALSGMEPSVPVKWWNSVAHGGTQRCRSAHRAASHHSCLSSPPAHRRWLSSRPSRFASEGNPTCGTKQRGGNSCARSRIHMHQTLRENPLPRFQ